MSADLWQPQFLSFKAALERAEELTPTDMEDAVAQLDDATRSELGDFT